MMRGGGAAGEEILSKGKEGAGERCRIEADVLGEKVDYLAMEALPPWGATGGESHRAECRSDSEETSLRLPAHEPATPLSENYRSGRVVLSYG